MSNEIKHYKFVLEFDSWQPFQRRLQAEIDELIFSLKDKKFLAHAGNVRLIEVD